MNSKNIFITVIFLVVILLITLFFIKKPVESPIIEPENNQQIKNISTYLNQNGEPLSIAYNTDNTANLIIDETNSISFNATSSEDGLKYENVNQGLILLKKDKEARLYLNDSLIYQGTSTK